VQFWLVAFTITATVLFGLILWRKPSAGPVRPLQIEGILLLSWWLVLAYAPTGLCLGWTDSRCAIRA
jgi:hypothetical protein